MKCQKVKGGYSSGNKLVSELAPPPGGLGIGARKPKGDDVTATKCCGTPLRLHPSLCDSCGREVKG